MKRWVIGISVVRVVLGFPMVLTDTAREVGGGFFVAGVLGLILTVPGFAAGAGS